MIEQRSIIFLGSFACTLFIFHYIVKYVRGQASRPPYPPGPPGRFFVGNLFDIPKKHPHLQYAQWSKLYNSDVVSLHVPGTHMVVVNTAKAAKDLFEKRSSIYSDRPHLEMFDLTGLEFAFGFMPYSDKWRAHRRAVHQWFRPDAISAYHPLLVARTGTLLKKVLDNPEAGLDLFQRSVGTFPLVPLYGRDIDLHDDPLVKTTTGATDILAQLVFPGAAMVNTFPFLKRLPRWFPGMHWTWKMADTGTILTNAVQYEPFNDVKTRMNIEGSSESESILANMLRQNDQEGKGEYGEWVMRRSAATINIASSDTSMFSISSAILALLLHPHVQARAQNEIDAVVGRDRLPSFSDRNQLPYISSIAKETLRWKMITPLAVSHASSQDDVYNGMFIPKGSIVTGNSWAILHDPEMYPNPDAFLPERFIASDGTLIDDELTAAFGFGRRMCIGRHFAYDVLWFSVAVIVSVFNIEKAKDKDVNDKEVTVEYTDTAASHPLPFECMMRPRDELAEALIKSQGDSSPDRTRL